MFTIVSRLGALDHMLADGLRAQERASQVNVDDLAPLLDREAIHHSGPGNAGIVDETMDCAESLDRPFDKFIDIGGFGDVRLHAQIPPLRIVRLGSRERLCVHVCDHGIPA